MSFTKTTYYEQAIPPVREQRVTIADSHGGEGCGFMECAKSGCMMKQSRRFWQANFCQMSLSLMMATTLENTCIVLHSPIGCGHMLYPLSPSSNKGKARRGKTPIPPVWLSTNLTEADVIGGGEQKLRETILYADREFSPEIIFVVATCAPTIIGDDIEEIVRTAGKETSAIITAIYCPGFKSRVVASAYDAFYHSLLRHIPLEPVPYRDYKPVEYNDPDYTAKTRRLNAKKKMTVNVFNATSIGPDDEEELKRLLVAIGLDVRFYAEYCNVDELRMMSYAGLNISMCNVHDDYILKYLQDEFDIPYIICGMPAGFAGTRAWLLEIAEHYGLADKAKAVIAEEEKMVRTAIEPILPAIRGKRVIIHAGVIRAGAEGLLLQELGFEVIGIRATHYDSNADPFMYGIEEIFPKIQITVSAQLFEMLNQINKLKPDFVVAHNGYHGALARAGIVSMQVFDTDKAFFGYAGIYRFAQRAAFALHNTSYTDRLGKNVKQPYKSDWWEKDTYSYIKE
jgi:nitrogenase molybdenum-iron protein alpha chain